MVGGLVGGPQMAAGISYVWPKMESILWDYSPLCGTMAQNCLSSLLLLAKSIVGVHERTQPLWCCNDKVGVVIRQLLPTGRDYW